MKEKTQQPDPNELEAEGHEDIARGHRKLAEAARLRAPGRDHGGDLIDSLNCYELVRLTPGTFASHARAGDFPSQKRGRRLVAFRRDVEAWAATRTRPPKPPSKEDDYDAVYMQFAHAGKKR